MSNKKTISEITGTGGSGSFKIPLNLAPRMWTKEQMGAFTEPVSHYLNPNVAYDSYDGTLKMNKQEINRQEKKAKKMANFMKKIENELPKGTPKYIQTQANLPKDEYKPVLQEDLAVWFGKKKKGKGSSQPQGPWVNICRKKEGGGHPPCGRPDADPKGYPKCRAAGVAAKMTDSQKKSACAQKRREEKKDTQSGKGQKPVMTSYKPKNESLREIIVSILREETSI